MREHAIRKATTAAAALLLLVASLSFANGQKEPSGQSAAAAPPDKITIISHRVHNTVTTTGAGGDVVADWEKQSGVANVDWITLGIPEEHSRLFREAALASGTIDVVFVLNTYMTPNITGLFMPLDSYMQKNPVEDYKDISQGLRNATTFDGKVYAIPFRQATSALQYNTQFFQDRGLSGPPKSAEEFIADIEKLTFKRSDGTQVYGFVIPGKGDLYANTVDLARIWDGDFITTDFQVKANQDGMMKAIQLMRDLYSKGMLPSDWTAIANTDLNTWMQQGRVAMTFSSVGRVTFYNDPKQSKYPGKFDVAPIPAAKEIQGKYPIAPVKTEFWSIMIPKNAPHKDYAWSFIQFITNKANTIREALNGNGPVRDSTFNDSQFQQKVPYWKVEQQELRYARIPLPAFDNAAQAADLFSQYAQAAILGKMSVQDAMDKLTAEVIKLVPHN